MVWRVGLDRTCLDRQDIRDVKVRPFCNSNTNYQTFIYSPLPGGVVCDHSFVVGMNEGYLR